MISSSAYVASDVSSSGEIVSSPDSSYYHDYLPQQNFHQLEPSVVLADAYSSKQLIAQNLGYDISVQTSAQFPNTSPQFIPDTSPEYIQSSFDTSSFSPTATNYIPTTGSYVSCTESFQASFNQVTELESRKVQFI